MPQSSSYYYLNKISNLLTSIWRWKSTRAVLVVLISASIFQLLPQRQNEAQSLSQIASDIVGGDWMPTCLGFWRVAIPKGQLHPRFPEANQVFQEAQELLPLVEELKTHKFFQIFKVDLKQECPFWVRSDLCSSEGGSCTVCECTDNEVPTLWKEKPTEHFVDLSAQVTPWLESSFIKEEDPSSFKSESQMAFLASMHGEGMDSAAASYVDLTINRPGFTSYRGRNVWGLIYGENCKQDSTCQEEGLFNKIISGLQTAITVLSSEYNKEIHSRWPLPFTSKTIGAGVLPNTRHGYNLDFFRRRVGCHEEWIRNLYLTFSTLIRTLSRVSGIVENCPCHTGTTTDDQEGRKSLSQLISKIQTMPSAKNVKSEPLFTTK